MAGKLTDDRLSEIAFKHYMELELCGAQPYQMLIIGVHIIGMTILRVTGRHCDFDSFAIRARDLIAEYISDTKEEE